jgi:hypothetical protein
VGASGRLPLLPVGRHRLRLPGGAGIRLGLPGWEGAVLLRLGGAAAARGPSAVGRAVAGRLAPVPVCAAAVAGGRGLYGAAGRVGFPAAGRGRGLHRRCWGGIEKPPPTNLCGFPVLLRGGDCGGSGPGDSGGRGGAGRWWGWPPTCHKT